MTEFMAEALPKGAAKAAISEPKAPLVGDLHNPFSVKSLWRNAGHPQVTSAPARAPDRGERQTGAGLTAIAFHLKPA
jgi:hypothetical protein